MLATAGKGKFLLSNVLPSLATGALAGVASAAAINKIAGNGVM